MSRRSRNRFKGISRALYSLKAAPSRAFGSLKPLGRKVGSAYGVLHNFLFDFSEKKIKSTGGEIESRKVPEIKSYLDIGFTIAECFRFGLRWLKTRPWKSLGQSSPALLLGLVIPYSFIQLGVASQANRALDYKRQVLLLNDAGDYAQADVLLRELRELEPDNRPNQYLQATTAQLAGDADRARRIMSGLAAVGYGPANRWMAQSHWEAFANGDRSDEVRQQLAFHVGKLLKVNPADREANRLMGTLLLQDGNTQQAVRHLREVADKDAAACLTIATVHHQQGDKERAKIFALQARELINQQLVQNPGTVKLYASLATTFVLAQDEDRGLQVLAEAYKSSKDPALRGPISDLYFSWGNRLLVRDRQIQKPTFNRVLQLFKKSLEANPQNLQVANRLADFSLQLEGEQGQQIADFLDNALADGVEPAIVHFMHGTRALLNGDSEAAQFHLDRALKDDPNTPGVLNNIAMSIVMSVERDPAGPKRRKKLVEALSLADKALQMSPGHPYLSDTRGQVLFRLGRYEECIANFEIALKEPQLRSAVYPFIASAYRELGQDRLANQFEKMGSEK